MVVSKVVAVYSKGSCVQAVPHRSGHVSPQRDVILSSPPWALTGRHLPFLGPECRPEPRSTWGDACVMWDARLASTQKSAKTKAGRTRPVAQPLPLSPSPLRPLNIFVK